MLISQLLFFFILFFWPGICILWLSHARWAVRAGLQKGGSIWLAIPSSFGLSITLISLLGWAGFFLHLGFYQVETSFLVIVGLLSVAAFVKGWFNRSTLLQKMNTVLHGPHPKMDRWEYLSVGFVLVVFFLAWYSGSWFSNTADSINHIAAVRSIIRFDNPVPKQIYWPNPVNGMDPTFGTWHLALAIWLTVSGLDFFNMWLIATILVSPIIVWTFIVFAFELTHSKPAAFISAVLYFLVGLSGDFRTAAQPNNMGKILFWLAFVFIILGVSAYTTKDKRQGLLFTVTAALFAWTNPAIHQQYAPVLLGITVPALAIAFILDFYKPFQAKLHLPGAKNYSWQAIIRVCLMVIPFATVGVLVRLAYTLSDKSPLTATATQAIVQTPLISLILSDLSVWFNSWLSVITIASILSVLLIFSLSKAHIGTIFLVVGGIIIPAFVILTSLIIGRGGLIYATFLRLTVLTPSFLYIGLGLQIVFLFPILLKALAHLFSFEELRLHYTIVVFAIILAAIANSIVNPRGGIFSIYSPVSSYETRLTVSQDGNLFSKRKEAIAFFDSLPQETTVLADSGVSYEMAGITGRIFIGLPSQHTPLQEKEINALTYQDVNDFMSGVINNRQMGDILMKNDIRYIYVDRTRYNGPIAWQRLPKLPFLDEVAGDGETWCIYQVNREKLVTYIDLFDKIDQSADFEKKIELLRQMRSLFENDEQFALTISQLIPINEGDAIAYLNEGDYFETSGKSGMVYDFLSHLPEGKITRGSLSNVKRTSFIINRQPYGIIFEHSTTSLEYTSVKVPFDSYLKFGITMDPAVWDAGKGDGVQFQVYIKHNLDVLKVFDQYIDPKNNLGDRFVKSYKVDLLPFAGEQVDIYFVTLPGQDGNDAYDWAGWVEPRIERKYTEAILDLWKSQISETIDENSKSMIHLDSFMINGEKRSILFESPDNQTTVTVDIPKRGKLSFGIGLDPAVWSPEFGDGVYFTLYARNLKTNEVQQIFNRYINPKELQSDRRWLDQEVDMGKFAGQQVALTFETTSGQKGDNQFDWAGWSSPILFSAPLVENNDLWSKIAPEPSSENNSGFISSP